MTFKTGQIYMINATDDLFMKAETIYNKKKFGRSDVTHCGIIAEVKGTDVLIYEALDKGFSCSWYTADWLNNDKRVRIVECKEKLTKVKENCEKYLGIGYGWLDILAIGASFLFGWRVLGLTGKNAIICSEAVSRVLYDCTKTIDFAKEYGIKFDAVTPQHIFSSKQVRIIK